MHGVSGGTASLSIQVVALHEDCMVTEATHPHITLTFTFQLDALTNVQPGKQHMCVTPPALVKTVHVNLFVNQKSDSWNKKVILNQVILLRFLSS